MLFGFFMILILFIIGITFLILINQEYNKKEIAIVQFNDRKFDPQLEEKIWNIADWYEFQNTADADFEIQDLKEHYKVVLEIK